MVTALSEGPGQYFFGNSFFLSEVYRIISIILGAHQNDEIGNAGTGFDQPGPDGGNSEVDHPEASSSEAGHVGASSETEVNDILYKMMK